MKIIVTEKRLLENAVGIKNSDYILPQFLFSKLKTHQTSLGDNPCFPMEQKYPFDYEIIKDRYKEVVDNVKTIKELETIDLQSVKNLCNKLLHECMETEKPIRDLLNDICRKTVNKLLYVPEDLILLKCHLVDKVEPKKAPRILPEDNNTNSYTFDDVNDMEMLNKTILKRRFINSLIQGGSYILSKYEDEYMDEIYKLDEKLPNLYKKISILSDYILFNEEEKIVETNYSPSAYVYVSLGNKNRKTRIESQANIFPYLLTETLRGFFELFSCHGLPTDSKKANYIISHADFVVAEGWDLRFGVGLWKRIFKDMDNVIIPYVFSEMSKLPTDEFNQEIKEILCNTKHGIKFMEELIDRCKRSINFSDLPQNYGGEDIKSLISDNTEENDMFTIDELNKIKL